jgi:uncharacterized protein (TIGR03437 family)
MLLGALIAIAAPAQTFTTLVNFNGTNGETPQYMALIQGTDGNFYGTTAGGGANGEGTVFKMIPAGALTTLYSFEEFPVNYGGSPYGGLIQAADGDFYGTTFGTLLQGTVFKITPGGTLTTLLPFNYTDGASPEAPLVQGRDGNFYGTTSSGGGGGLGTVFKITPSGTLTTLHNFCLGECSDGALPMAGLIQATDGNFYGTTSGGNAADGTVFKITPEGTLTTLYAFGLVSGDGYYPSGGLIQAKDGNFYGTTTQGGANGNGGAIFRITPAGTLTTTYSFSGGSDGGEPWAGLIQASDGNFYGTTAYGGANGWGTIFEITPAGALITLHSFTGTDGARPLGALVQGNDGKLYGTTCYGGTSAGSDGTIFSLTLPNTAGSAPAISSGGIISAYSFGAFTAVAPGSWIDIYGNNLAADSRAWTGADFNGNTAPMSLDGTSVTIGGQPAFIDYISPGQVNAQVPSGIGTGSQPVVVTSPAGASAPLTLTVNAEEPGLLAPPTFKINGTQYVAALFSDGSTYVLPPGASSSVPSRRASPGDVITLYGIGFGAVTPSVAAGQITPGQNTLATPLHIRFGQTDATVQYDGLAPQTVGLYQFNVEVPNVASSDSVPLTFTLGGVPGPQTLYISVQNGALAPAVQSLTLSSNSVAGGGSVQGTVTLSEPAPSAAVVSLSSSASAASVPASVTIPAGSSSAIFTVTAGTVGASQSVTITAAYSGSEAQATLTVTPPLAPPFQSMYVTILYQPAGFASGQIPISMTLNADNTTYTVEVISGLLTFTNGTFSNQNQTLTANVLQSSTTEPPYGVFMAPGGNMYLTSSASLTFTLTQTGGAPGVYSEGNLAGTLSVTGTPDPGGATPVTLAGAITGTYLYDATGVL